MDFEMVALFIELEVRYNNSNRSTSGYGDGDGGGTDDLRILERGFPILCARQRASWQHAHNSRGRDGQTDSGIG